MTCTDMAGAKIENDIDVDGAANGLEDVASKIESIVPRLREVAGRLRKTRDIEASKAEIEVIFSDYEELLAAI